MSSTKIPKVEIGEFDINSMPLSCTWIIIGPPASGKCLARDTPVVLYNGTIKMVQDITTEDTLMGDDGTPRTVWGTTTGRDKMYKITSVYGDGSREDSYTVNEPHVLSLKYISTGCKLDISVKDYLGLPECQQKELYGYRSCVHPEMLFDMYSEKGSDLLEIITLYGVPFEKGIRFTFDTQNTSQIQSLVYLARLLGIKTRVFDVLSEDNYLTQIEIYTTSQNYVCPETVDVSDMSRGYPIKVEYLGEGDYYGFELDGNHRFLLGDFTVSHNTTLMENLAYYRKHVYPVGRVFIGTEDGYKHFCKIFHPLYVSNYWDEKEEENHVRRQRTCEMENGRGYPGNYAVNIIDDVSDDPKIYKSKLMRGLFKLGSQHYAQLCMIGSQYAIDMPPDIRKAVSYVALGREPEEIERKKLYENFGGLAGSYARFCDLMDQITGDHTFLIFKKRSQSNNLEDCVSWLRTKKLGDWKFGCKEYRAHGETRYDPNYVEQIIM